MRTFGGIIFVAGLVIAAAIAIFSAADTPQWAVFALAILGLIVGLINIGDREVQTFLIASLAFLISFSALSNIFTILAFGWEGVATFFGLMNVFIAPAVAVVAVKALFLIARD